MCEQVLKRAKMKKKKAKYCVLSRCGAMVVNLFTIAVLYFENRLSHPEHNSDKCHKGHI